MCLCLEWEGGGASVFVGGGGRGGGVPVFGVGRW